MADNANAKKVIDDIANGKTPELKHATTVDGAARGVAVAKVLKAVEGEHHLKHVSPPADGLSDAVKSAFLEEKKEQK